MSRRARFSSSVEQRRHIIHGLDGATGLTDTVRVSVRTLLAGTSRGADTLWGKAATEERAAPVLSLAHGTCSVISPDTSLCTTRVLYLGTVALVFSWKATLVSSECNALGLL